MHWAGIGKSASVVVSGVHSVHRDTQVQNSASVYCKTCGYATQGFEVLQGSALA